jgi:phosphoribosylformylglycinamidine synthase
LKKTVLDPQGRAITNALRGHGHDEIVGVRQGKYFEVELAPGATPESARSRLEKLAAEVLANPVIEDYEVTILEKP